MTTYVMVTGLQAYADDDVRESTTNARTETVLAALMADDVGM